MMYKSLHSTILILFLLASCTSKSSSREEIPSVIIKSKVKISAPKGASRLKLGDTLQFTISSKDKLLFIDSVALSLNGYSLSSNFDGSNISIFTKNLPVGRHFIEVSAVLSNKETDRKRIPITLLSPASPAQYTYKLISTFPHDSQAFTQGLTIDDGKLYESTGQNGQSSLRLVDLASGNVIKSSPLENKYFGEGSAVIGDNLYFITWTTNKGFVFNKSTFERIAEFQYSTEGWGLTNTGDTLVMSDGTENVYYKDNHAFTDLRTIQVYDHQGPVDNLNELEFVNNKLFANRWMTDDVYMINPYNGVVEGIINLEGLLTDDEKQKSNADVLNGIAYDKTKDKLYVTGKYWPKLFEIGLIKRAGKSK